MNNFFTRLARRSRRRRWMLFSRLWSFRFRLALCLLLPAGLAPAQHTPVKFEQLPPELDLAQGAVNCILQDHRGILWLGTWSGLVRYDGCKIRVFQQESGKTDGLQSDQITSLLEDHRGQLWIGTLNAGLQRFDRATERFVNFRTDVNDPNSLSGNDVWGLFEDSKGYIWVGTQKELNRFDPATNTFLRIAKPASRSERPPSDYIYSICETPDGSIWSATAQGLHRIRFRNSHDYDVRQYSLDPQDRDISLDNFIYRVRPARQEANTLWLGTKAGLKKVRFDPVLPDFLQVVATFRHAPGDATSLSHNIVSDFWEAPDGDLWVATYHGLNRFYKSTGRFSRFFAEADEPFPLSSNFIRCLFQDRTGILWIGTEKGANKLNLTRKPFQGIRFDQSGTASNSNITSICQATAPGSLWVATNDGLHRLDYSAQPTHASQYVLSPPHLRDFANFITAVWRDRDGWLWLTTQGAGVLRIREQDLPAANGVLTKLEQFSQSSPALIHDNYIMNMLESGSEGMWFGLWDGGLELFDRTTGTTRHFHTVGSVSLTAFPNVALLEAIEGGVLKLYVGTRGNGLLKCAYDPTDHSLRLEQHYHFVAGQAGSLSNNKVNALLRDSRGRIWVCTSRGLNLLEAHQHRFRHFNQAEGLPNDIAQSIVEDRPDHFWVSTQNGIASLHLSEDGKAAFRAYNKLDGLQDNFFTNNCAIRLPSGLLAFGGASGVTMFTPDAIRSDTVPPLTQLSDFLLFNRSVPIGFSENGRAILPKSIGETSEITLDYRENVLSFEFVSLHFAEPKKNRYAYQLEGFDQNWVYTDAEKRFAHYTNLPYREFTFRVKSANGDGIWGQPVSVKVQVRAPFWLTWWAYCCYALLFAGLLYAAWRVAHLRAEYSANLALERIQRDQLEKVNRLKLQFFTNISHELRTPLTLILTPLEQLIKESGSDKKLHQLYTVMHHNADRLHTMINQLLDLRKGDEGMMRLRVTEDDFVQFIREITLSFKSWADQRRIQLDFIPAAARLPLWFDKEQLEKVAYNLLANAIKYTPSGGRVQVNVASDERICTFTVSDTGAGIADADTQRIFERFYQVEQNQGATVEEGAGIGLALVKMLVEQHHGTVSVQSNPGGGSVFRVELPLGNHYFKPEELANDPTQGEVPEYACLGQANDYEPITPHNATVVAAKNDHVKSRLLIVEDNTDIAQYLCQNPVAEFMVETASNGMEGLAQALAHPPDLIVSDIAMPEMDGIELCRRMKTNILTSHIPVILLTARTSLIFKIDGLDTGADDYITKPFNLQLLTLRIRNLIIARRKLREKFSRNIGINPSEVSVNSRDEEFLRNILVSVEQHMDESEFSVDQLAHDLHMSRMQLYRKIKALTGDTPNALVRTVRLKKAAQLLHTRQYNVSEVAYKVGFTDLKYFRERFREQFGVNPGEYWGTVGSRQ